MMPKNKILYAEDDETLAFLTKDNLEMAGYEVHHATDGLSCLTKFRTEAFDICILDIMMPKIDGFEVAAEIRQTNLDIPILFLSAKTLKEDRIKGLKIGADDYLIKPFSMEELILKIEIFMKRSNKEIIKKRNSIKIGSLEFDTQNYKVTSKISTTKLTQRESELLLLLIENKNIVLKRDFILEKLWGENDYFLGRSLDVFISRLRKIVCNESGISIENIHGVGFRLNCDL